MSSNFDIEQSKRESPELHATFHVVQRLGDGAAATVYLVQQGDDTTQYALKVLTNEQAFDENTMERFREELRICQGIRHPNIVEAYQLLTLDGKLAYVMEYIEGADLSQLFKQSRFGEAQIDSIFRQLLPAITELHRNGVLHRDIKLENILLRKDGTIKLSDLGLMKQFSKDLTATGVILGTAHYLPPEYVRDGIYDVRSEVYVLGTLLYEMVSGERWLAHLKGAQALEHLIKTGFSFPIDSIPNLAPRYRSILKRSLAYNPQDRFSSAQEMLAAIDGKEAPQDATNEEQSDTPAQEMVADGDGTRNVMLIVLMISLVGLCIGAAILLLSLAK